MGFIGERNEKTIVVVRLPVYFKDPSHPALGNPEAKEIKMLILSKILLFTQAKSQLCSPLT